MKTITRMKQFILTAILMLCLVSVTNAQEIMHSTNWEGSLSGWTVVNDVADSPTWVLRSNDAGLEVVNTVDAASIEWFVSPQFDFSAGDTYTVEFEKGWNDSQNGRLDVYYAEDYAGDVSAASWQVLGEDILNGQSTGWKNFNSYNTNNTIPSTSPNVRIAFKYASTGFTMEGDPAVAVNKNRVRLKNFVLTTSGINPIKLIPYGAGWEYTLDDWNIENLAGSAKTWEHKDKFDTNKDPVPNSVVFITDSKSDQDDWLISPAIKCSDVFQKEVVFKAAWKNQQSSNISVHYSTDYAGDKATASWTTLGSDVIPESHAFGFSTSDYISLSFPTDVLAPKVYFAISYGPFKAPITDDPDISQNEIRVMDFKVQEYYPTAIKNNKIQSVKLFPNPATSILNVDVTGEAEVEIYNVAGQLVKAASIRSNQVDVSDLNPGQYIITVKLSDAVYINRFIKK
ncbi:MAG: T9SS type A sorting domain-containing protein [Marinilabiliaceae bacterium]|nr:T9SS type A sorting domain-containing protein [Marinilabiliaceae bacterium]